MNVRIVQRRWADLQPGDVIRDGSWVAPRWVVVARILDRGGYVEAWFDGSSLDGRGYQTSGFNLVEVQTADPEPRFSGLYSTTGLYAE